MNFIEAAKYMMDGGTVKTGGNDPEFNIPKAEFYMDSLGILTCLHTHSDYMAPNCCYITFQVSRYLQDNWEKVENPVNRGQSPE
jgi:hypothetical protein